MLVWTISDFLVVPKGDATPSNAWKKLVFGTMYVYWFSVDNLLKHFLIISRPNILAFNLATSIRIASAMLVILMIFSGVLLYVFYRETSACCRIGRPEGFQQPLLLANQWGLVITSFLLTAVYLPLSTMAVHVIVWSDDLWVVPNPYVNATAFPPQLPPLGPASEFRGPLEFCYVTTMERNQYNYAPLILIVALVSFFGVSPSHWSH